MPETTPHCPSPLPHVLARTAGLLHDWGKATPAFQRMLRSNSSPEQPEPHRHELLSALLARRLFDNLASWNGSESTLAEAIRKSQTERQTGFSEGARLALFYKGDAASDRLRNLVLWLILSHHRLPTSGAVPPLSSRDTRLADIRDDWTEWTAALQRLEAGMHLRRDASHEDLVVSAGLEGECTWISELASALPSLDRAAAFLREDLGPRALSLVGRIALICADREVSMGPCTRRPGRADLLANTRDGHPNQTLAEHLTKVSKAAERWCDQLQHLGDGLPSISERLPFASGSAQEAADAHGRFAWQDAAVQEIADGEIKGADGFFGILRAGTGSGKTRGAARIMQALGKGAARFSVTTPMRTLTTQTAEAYREDLGFADCEVVRLVGEAIAVADGDDGEFWIEQLGRVEGGRSKVSAPLECLLSGREDVQRLTGTAVSVSTLDYLMPSVAQGRTNFVLSTFRLATADVVLDELDGYSPGDLVAIGRLVHLAGFFGRRVLCVSATLPPDVSLHLAQAYCAGYALRRALGWSSGQVWGACFDERMARLAPISDFESLLTSLPCPEVPAKHRYSWSEVSWSDWRDAGTTGRYEIIRGELIRQQEALLGEGKRDVILVVRLSRIESVTAFARYLDEHGLGNGSGLGILCWHGRMLMAQRGLIEHTLRRLLNRKDGSYVSRDPVFTEIAQPTADAPRCLVVIASPVVERGQDHDYDGGVVEPSSLASVIQCAGRVGRHRDLEPRHANIHVLPGPLVLPGPGRSRRKTRACYTRPGPEADGWETPFQTTYRLRIDDLSVFRIVSRDVRENPLLAVWRDTDEVGVLPDLERSVVLEHLALEHRFSLRGFLEQPLAWLGTEHFSTMQFRASSPRLQLHWCAERKCLMRRTVSGHLEPIDNAESRKQGKLVLANGVLRQELLGLANGQGLPDDVEDLLSGSVSSDTRCEYVSFSADLGLDIR